MAEFNHARKEITFKLVYYGPALSGKTTNLQMIHEGAGNDSTGELMTLNTEGDRTLFFDMLPVRMKTASGFSIRLKLFTVPGQVQHNSTRKIVLRGSDGIVFVADSSAAVSKQNAESFDNLLITRDDGLRTPDVRVKVNDVDITPALAEKFASFNPFGYPSNATSPYPGFRLVWPQMKIDEEMPLEVKVEVRDALGNVNQVIKNFSVAFWNDPIFGLHQFPLGLYAVPQLRRSETQTR